MRNLQSIRSAAQTASGFALATLLVACGGSPAPFDADAFGRDVGGAIVNSFICALANCKASGDVPIQDIAMNYTVRQSAGQLLIQVQLRQQSKSAPLQLTAGDRLTVEFAGKVTDLKEDSAGSTTFVASFAASAAQPSVKLSFVRAGQSYSSMATVPPRFEVLSPSAAVAMNRQSADLDVVLQLPATSTPSLVGTTHCVLQNGSAWDGSIALPFERVDGNNSQQRLRLPAAALARAVDNAFAQSTSKPQACRLQPSWVLIQDGAAPAGLHAAGTRQAQFAAGVTIDFDAKP